MEAVQIV